MITSEGRLPIGIVRRSSNLLRATISARRLGVDSEVGLREANKRFYRRFSCMEELCRQRGLTFGNLSFDEQNVLWEEAKRKME